MSKKNAKPAVNGGEILLKAVAEEGIEWIFGIPGGEFLPFLEAATRLETRITYVGVRHEQACGMMADAVARVKISTSMPRRARCSALCST